jgi:hypothetical protein
MRLSRVLTLIVLGSVGCSDPKAEPLADSALGAQVSDSARAFVQAFYDWYTAQPAGALREALRRDTLLAPDLSALLTEDLAVLREENPPRTTLDGDPFVGQDPCPPFAAQMVRATGKRFRVDVLPACAAMRGSPYATPVTLEVAHTGKRWQIVNVYIGRDSVSLFEYLCKYAREDRRPEKRPARCGLP